MLGSKKCSYSLNTILLLSKQYICSCNINISLPNINVFKSIVKAHTNIENYRAKAICTLVQFESKWRQFAAALASLYNIVNVRICLFVPKTA